MFNLVCIHPFVHHKTGKSYAKGQLVDDQDEVGSLSDDRGHHFVRVAAPEPEFEPDPEPAPAPVAKPSTTSKSAA
jgi:hypothetical protein